ncbi:MAG: hypothetical protein PGN13_11010 [Patulibacter minatonensis]
MRRPPLPAPRPLAASTRLAFAGLFALLVGLLLRGAVGKQDDTDWNGAVRAFLDLFPLVLVAGGVVLLLSSAVMLVRRDASRPGDG